MYRFLFEELWKLLLCWAALQFALVCLWSRTRSPKVGVACWVLLGLLPILSASSILIRTPAEQIIETCRRVARAIDEGDIQSVAAHVSSDFQAGDLERSVLLERLERTLTRYRVDHPRLRGFEVTTTGETVAEANFLASCQVRTAEFTRPNLPSKWRVRFRRAGDNWRITEIESLPVPPLNVRRLNDWLR